MQSYTDADVVLTARGLNLVPLTYELVERFVPHLSQANIEEFTSVLNMQPRAALQQVVNAPFSESYAIMAGDTPLAVTGVSQQLDSDVMWVSFSQELRKHFVKFTRASPALIRFYHERYPTLTCDVWVKAEAIIQWLAMLDFEPEFEFAQNGESMIRFVRYCSEEESVVTCVERPVIH